MVTSSRPPALGGEIRDVTVFFSDLAGFSSIAETMKPADLVALMNRYLSAMTDVIEAHGGFVDKYMGDGIVAVFGAPAEARTTRARACGGLALACVATLDALNAAAPRGRPLAHRIGLNSGPALVGNIGSRRRFNYTVTGDAVNLASRLEGANKYFGTAILAAEAPSSPARLRLARSTRSASRVATHPCASSSRSRRRPTDSQPREGGRL